MDWPDAEPVVFERLLLEPLLTGHASVMVDVLADPSLYHYTGGEAPSCVDLRRQYAVQTPGQSADGEEWWLNWVVILRDSREPVGYVQATVEGNRSELVADIAWVTAPSHQRQGVASEAADAMVGWLRSHGVCSFTAHIHPDHQASMGVARHLDLRPSSAVKDGEARWES